MLYMHIYIYIYKGKYFYIIQLLTLHTGTIFQRITKKLCSTQGPYSNVQNGQQSTIRAAGSRNAHTIFLVVSHEFVYPGGQG